MHEVGLSYRRQILDFNVEVSAAGPLTPSISSAALRDLRRALRRHLWDRRRRARDRLRREDLPRDRDRPGAAAGSARLVRRQRQRRAGGAEPIGTRAALADDRATELTEVPVYRGEDLRPVRRLCRPGDVEYADTTILVPIRAAAMIDARPQPDDRGADVVIETARRRRLDPVLSEILYNYELTMNREMGRALVNLSGLRSSSSRASDFACGCLDAEGGS